MDEVQFQRVTLDDRELIHSYFTRFPSQSCERTFVNNYLLCLLSAFPTLPKT